MSKQYLIARYSYLLGIHIGTQLGINILAYFNGRGRSDLQPDVIDVHMMSQVVNKIHEFVRFSTNT